MNEILSLVPSISLLALIYYLTNKKSSSKRGKDTKSEITEEAKSRNKFQNSYSRPGIIDWEEDDIDAKHERLEKIIYDNKISIEVRIKKKLGFKKYQKYLEYLKSPEWELIRSKVIERAGGICEECNKASATEVHHLTYDRIFCESMEDLLAVCRTCHEKIHEIKPVPKEPKEPKEEKEKFQEYLNSLEWLYRRNEVMKRACGICEHCKKKPATQIRHITFVRIYKELLEDLIAICDHCNSTQKNLKSHIEKPVKYAPIIIYVITSLIVLVTIILVLLKTYTHIL